MWTARSQSNISIPLAGSGGQSLDAVATFSMIAFTKMNGAGNDFIVLDNRDLTHQLSREEIALLCDRNRGVGADGLLAVEPAEGDADFRMRYYNADGGEAEMCGNGARCFGRFVREFSGESKDCITFETIAGIISAEYIGDNVRVGLSSPLDLTLNTDLELLGQTYPVHSVNTGVPHATIFTENLANADILGIGAALRFHDHFAPSGTNANLAEVLEPGKIAIRTYERGVEAETLACGTGMAACALLHDQLTGAGSPVSVRVKGGDTLEVGFDREANTYSNVTLCGPADLVFSGEISL